jgi:hypothetical protein
VSAIKATGRKTLLISGVATELAVQLPALTAAEQGYRVYVVLDACGGMSERTEQAALLRLAKAGATTVSVMTLAGELLETFARLRPNKQSEYCTRWPKRHEGRQARDLIDADSSRALPLVTDHTQSSTGFPD